MKLPATGRLVLLADSQLLFPGRYSGQFLEQIQRWVSGQRGVYIGASNGDVPEFYQLAQEAFSALGATLAWQKAAEPATGNPAEFYVLAGGDVADGWRYLRRPDVLWQLQQAREQNALFIGVSAGAIHLGYGFAGRDDTPDVFLGWLGAAVAAHEERDQWPTLQHWKRTSTVDLPLLTLPMGGALVVSDGHACQAGKGCGVYLRGGPVQALPWLIPSGCS